MSRSGNIRLDWAGEVRDFRLKLKQLDQLDEACGRGPMRMMFDLMGGDWKARDVYETIRLGLIGGGLAPDKAVKLCREYVEEAPLQENILTAVAILQAAISGPKIAEDVLKGPAPPGEAQTAEIGSTSLSSTETGPPSESRTSVK